MKSEAMQWCEWCVADSGRTGANRPCCIARRASKLPGFGWTQAVRAVTKDHGVDAGAEFKRAVLLVTAMRLARANKGARLLGYKRIADGGGTPADIDELKALTKQEYEKAAA